MKAPGALSASRCAFLLVLVAGASQASVAWPQTAVDVPKGRAFLHDIRPGPGVDASFWLSRYLPSLADTPGDTPVYLLEGERPGATVLLAGGTHANEIAGIISAVVVVERARVASGRLIVIPHANNSAISYRDPVHPGPRVITLTSGSGPRRFAYGARRTRPEHQGAADPGEFRHPGSNEALPGNEARNLDRAYPGRFDGNLTERVACAVMNLLTVENVEVAFDLHEAGPRSRLAWMVVAHPKSLDLAALAVIGLDAAGVPMKLEMSSETFRGLSHREWGDGTGAATFLIETPNPAQADDAEGADVLGHPELPLARRVGVHLATVQAILDAWNATADPASRVVIEGLPTLPELTEKGIGAFLR